MRWKARQGKGVTLLNDKMSDIILDLPEVIRPLATIYGNVIERVGKHELMLWIEQGLLKDWRDGHAMMVLKMSTQEVIDHLDLTNAAIEQLNKENAVFVTLQKQAFVKLALAGLGAL